MKTAQSFANVSDEEIVEQLKSWAARWLRTGFNSAKANRINDEEIVPRCTLLGARGEPSIQKLLDLTEDERSEVQLLGATFAYDTNPGRCRRVLERLMRRNDIVGLFALVMLLDKDPEFVAEYESLAKLGDQRCEEEMTRRYGARW